MGTPNNRSGGRVRGAHATRAAPAGGSGGSGGLPLVRDVRPMPIRLVTVSKGNSPAAIAMADEWLEKLRRYTSVTGGRGFESKIRCTVCAYRMCVLYVRVRVCDVLMCAWVAVPVARGCEVGGGGGGRWVHLAAAL